MLFPKYVDDILCYCILIIFHIVCYKTVNKIYLNLLNYILLIPMLKFILILNVRNVLVFSSLIIILIGILKDIIFDNCFILYN